MAGIPFTVRPIAAEEPLPQADDQARPGAFVEKLAQWKAAACAAAPTEGIVLAADTIVWHRGEILNKPRDEAEAVTMLRRLRGEAHRVFTGLCLRIGDTFHTEHEVTTVRFGHVSDHWIDLYVATGEPADKAGAYAAQGQGTFIVAGIEGDFYNVVGLPLSRLGRMLEKRGIPVENWWRLHATEA